MKYTYTLLLFIMVALASIKAQVPNSGFENWTDGEPDEWLTINTDPYFTITQSNNSHSGVSALKGEVISFQPPFLPVLAPYAICAGPDDEGFIITQRYNSLKGYYKFNPQGGDQLIIWAYTAIDTQGIGVGSVTLGGASSYTEFRIPITYISSSVPDRCIIVFQVLNPVGGIVATLGSEMYLDNLQLSMDVVSGVDDAENIPTEFMLSQNYPNPFNPSTTISFSIPNEEFVSLKVFNSLGEEVAELLNATKPAGNYSVSFNASSLTSGVYFYKISAGNFVETKKMLLMK